MVSNPEADAVRHLMSLGLNEIEASIYCTLLKQPDSTGYGVAKIIGKAHANVYQGLNGLEAKGAVIVEESDKRTYRPVPVAEFVGRLRQSAEERCDAAFKVLTQFELAAPEEDRFFQLKNKDQVLARGRSMLEEAQETVLIQAFPLPMSYIREDLIKARDRGVLIAGMVLREEDLIEGTRCAVSLHVDMILRKWTHPHLTVVVDGRAFLLALFHAETGDLMRSVSVQSPYVASIFHNGIVSDTVLHTHPLGQPIGSPNEYLFGRMNPAFEDMFRDSGTAEAG